MEPPRDDPRAAQIVWRRLKIWYYKVGDRMPAAVARRRAAAAGAATVAAIQHATQARLITSHCIALHCIVLHCVAMRCIALRCIALHCVALYCIALHSKWRATQSVHGRPVLVSL